MTVVWVGLDGNDIVISHTAAWLKLENIKRDPRVAVSVQSPTFAPSGAQESLVVYGTASVQDGGAYDLAVELSHMYPTTGPHGSGRRRGSRSGTPTVPIPPQASWCG